MPVGERVGLNLRTDPIPQEPDQWKPVVVGRKYCVLCVVKKAVVYIIRCRGLVEGERNEIPLCLRLNGCREGERDQQDEAGRDQEPSSHGRLFRGSRKTEPCFSSRHLLLSLDTSDRVALARSAPLRCAEFRFASRRLLAQGSVVPGSAPNTSDGLHPTLPLLESGHQPLQKYPDPMKPELRSLPKPEQSPESASASPYQGRWMSGHPLIGESRREAESPCS